MDSRRPHLLAALAIAAFAGCGEKAPDPPGPGGDRSATGVIGKPIADTPLGPAIADELVVGFVPGTPDGAAASIAAGAGGELVWRGPRTGHAVVRFPAAAAAKAGLPALAARAEVVEVRPSYVVAGAGIGTTPGLMDVQWNLWGLGLDPFQDPGDAFGVIVAVLDTGAAFEDRSDATGTYALAPDLAGATFVSGHDFIHDDPNPNDDHGHGTHVTGIIAASSGITPLAAGAAIMPIKVLDASNMGTEIGLAEGLLLAAERGADVVNMSLSFSPAFFPSRFLQAAVASAAAGGVVMVAAAGNHGGDGVAFPAAFRDVLAVGASRLEETYRPAGSGVDGNRWRTVAPRGLAPAGYSNRGFLIDFVAPAGVVDADVDGDGNPEAVVAQTFAGDPTEFDYYLFAGTSQAAAQASAVAARVLHERAGLLPAEVRALMGGTALRTSGGNVVLDQRLGRGFVDARSSMLLAPTGSVHGRPGERYLVSLDLSFATGEAGERTGRAEVRVLDESGDPAGRVWVYGTFTGGIHVAVSGRADASGTISFAVPGAADARAIAFQVDAVASPSRKSLDRPRGATLTDSCSLDRLAHFSATLAGDVPITLRAAGAPEGSLRLGSFSSGLATVPMVVAVDADWFHAAFPGAAAATVVSYGQDDVWLEDDSFPDPVPPSGDECVPLIIQTFAGGHDATAPLAADPSGPCAAAGTCAALGELLEAMWLGTAGPWDSGAPVSAATYSHLSAVVSSYAAFQAAPAAAPAAAYGEVLSAAGVGLVPHAGDGDNGAGVAGLAP